MSGALGLGGGAIFNPLLMSMGVPPTVASSTGMYMIMFSSAGSSLVYIIYNMLNIPFAFWIGIWVASGSVIGLYILNEITRKYNRQSPIVMVLSFVLGLSALSVAVIGALELKRLQDSGHDILEFRKFC